jgi:hypothetical protein
MEATTVVWLTVMAKKTPDHHELPKLYLRGFCESSMSFLWVFERGRAFNPGVKRSKHNPYRSGLRETGLRGDHYAVRIPGQRPDYSYEVRLQQEEHKADRTIGKIRNREAVDKTDKAIIARYIGLMRKRLTRRDIAMAVNIEESINRYSWDDLERELAFAGQFGAALQVPDTKAWFQTEQAKTKLLRESMLQPFERAHQALLLMNWTFQVAPVDRYFVTTDNPVVFDEQRGILNSQLIFPLSKDITLLAQWSQASDLEYRELSVEEARKINVLTILAATKEVYAPKPDEWIYQGWEHGFASP